MTLIERINALITSIGADIKALTAGKVDKTATIGIANGGTGATTLAGAQTALGIVDNSSLLPLLPRKIGASQRWYQSGLRHGADYPYPYLASNLTSVNGCQYFAPFTALEDATITELEIQCTTTQSNATVRLGIYASDGNNDIANPLFTSSPISCSATGAKNATCNVKITKGSVYWLSSLPTGTPAFHRNATDSLFPIKGATAANQSAIIGYYTTGNTNMAQSAPTNKVDLVTAVPRVMFVVA